MKDYILAIVVFIIIVVIFVVGIGISMIGYSNTEEIKITVMDKYIKRSGDYDKYMVVDTLGNAYEISDLMFIGKFNSTDLYNQLKIGHTYIVSISGVRNNFFSMYKNINRIIEEVR